MPGGDQKQLGIIHKAAAGKTLNCQKLTFEFYEVSAARPMTTKETAIGKRERPVLFYRQVLPVNDRRVIISDKAQEIAKGATKTGFVTLLSDIAKMRRFDNRPLSVCS